MRIIYGRITYCGVIQGAELVTATHVARVDGIVFLIANSAS